MVLLFKKSDTANLSKSQCNQLGVLADQIKSCYVQKNKTPDFSFDELLTSMGQGADHAAGKITARAHQLSARAEAISASEIAANT